MMHPDYFFAPLDPTPAARRPVSGIAPAGRVLAFRTSPRDETPASHPARVPWVINAAHRFGVAHRWSADPGRGER